LHVPLAFTKYVVLLLGDTFILLPLSIGVPPQEPAYQYQLAAVPRLPPTTLMLVASPLQIGELPLMLAAAVDNVLTVTVVEIHAVLLHEPSPRKKYVVVELGLTLITGPLPTRVPPQLSVYQFQLAPVPNEPPTTLNEVFEPSQMVVVPLMLVGSVESVSTLTVIDEQAVVSQLLSALT
jgi:hypothetical protein